MVLLWLPEIFAHNEMQRFKAMIFIDIEFNLQLNVIAQRLKYPLFYYKLSMVSFGNV